MNKTAWKIFIYFTLLSACISIILLCINAIGIIYIGAEPTGIYSHSQQWYLQQVSEKLLINDNGITMTDPDVIPKNCWCILLDENGDIVWSHHKPEDIPEHYSLNDVARMTHWYLNDYPVYVRTEDYGLLVMGIPKNSVGKYSLEFSMDWFEYLPNRIISVIIFNLIFAAVLALIFGINLYRKIKNLTSGIKDLRQEKQVRLKEKGIFRELAVNINETSESIGRKNAALQSRDQARSNWIAGISHDIRTPLSMIMGYSEQLSKSEDLSEEDQKKAGNITRQSLKIKKLIEDLNLISSLEYDMQPSKKKDVLIGPMLRNIVSEILNHLDLQDEETRSSDTENLPNDNYPIDLSVTYEQAAVTGDERLLERAFFNLISNCITHNPAGCTIRITEYKEGSNVCIRIADDGCGVSEEILKNINTMPKTAHGIGLPMAYKIFHVHGGKMTAKNDSGFVAVITLPMKSAL